MLVIGCYTEGTPYEEEAKLLMSSLDAVGMEHLIKPYESQGDWYDNTRHKVFEIREMRRHLDGPLLYVDVDTFFHENCEAYFEKLAAQGYDFGAHWWRGPAKGHDFSQTRERGWWMLSTTMFLGDTDGCWDFLTNWYRLNKLWAERGIREGAGQKNGWFTLTCMDHLKVARLPNRYNYIFDKSPKVYLDEPCIIEHTIASRENRDGNVGKVRPKRREKIKELKESLNGI